MDLDRIQNRVVNSKVVPYSVLRGAAGSGKTTAAIHRVIYLKNSYCLYDEDKILMVAENNEKIEKLNEMYAQIEKSAKYDYITLFTNEVNRVHLCTVEELIEKCFIEFERKNGAQYSLLEDRCSKREILYKCIKENKIKFPLVRMMNYDNVSFFIDEIMWIKSCGYLDLNSYQNANRLGRKVEKGKGPTRLIKNSLEREAIYNLMIIYNNRLREMALIDKEDKALMALFQAKKERLFSYTHLVIDESQSYTRVQLDLLKEMKNCKSYSSIIYVHDKDELFSQNAWLIKGRSFSSLSFEEKPRSFLFSKKYVLREDKAEGNDKLIKTNGLNSLESYKYLDIRHQVSFDFKKDTNNMSELILGEEKGETIFTADELAELPVFNDIAAGEPIYISPEVEDKFYLPNCWLKGFRECFMLKVKGDSMINAAIEDGDFVVIRKQSMAQNREIVAVDIEGSATLKRLRIEKDRVLLMPENEKYDAIPVSEDGARIIGVAVGVLKKN